MVRFRLGDASTKVAVEERLPASAERRENKVARPDARKPF
jgi:hypothetical protein